MQLRKWTPLWLLAAPVALFAQEAPAPAPAPTQEQSEPVYQGPTVYGVRIIARYPHDPGAYTQGLLWHEGALYESTGRVGQSRVRKVDLETGKVLGESLIPADQFGEGLALWGDEFISLTWRDSQVHRWRLDDLSPISTYEEFPYEGWGLTTSEEGLIHSDGSSTLRVLDPETYEVRREIEVTINGRPLSLLNELEMIDGLVFANVWKSGFIAAIDPVDGTVKKLIDLRGIVNLIEVEDTEGVLNGIAWDAENRRLFVTGKLWPELFEIALFETDARVR